MATTVRLPNVRARVAAIRGAHQTPDLKEAVRRGTHETAEALTDVQNALDVLSKQVNALANPTTTTVKNINLDEFGGVDDGVTDNWGAFRAAILKLKQMGGGRLTCRWRINGRYRVGYDATDATRTSSTGAIDLSPWQDAAGTWHATENIEIYFEAGVVLFMDNLLPNGYDAQTHAIYARCRWTNSGGTHTPSTWNGYAVNFGALRFVNVCVEWTLGSQRGIGDSFHFAGTKSKTTAPYDITLENCSAFNAPQVGTIFMGCKQVHVTNFYAESCYADTCHFNACFEGCTAQNVKAVSCGDDTLAVVTYYADAATLAAGPDIDTEVGPFASVDQTSANNNGLQATNIQKIGGRANAVRLFGANRVCITNIYADAASSANLDAAVWAGSVKANGTTLAQSGMAPLDCQIAGVIARGGVQVGVHIVALGFSGSEGDAWLLNNTAARGINTTGCAQVSVWGHDCHGFTVDGVRYDTTKCDFTNVKNIILDNFEGDGEFNITAASSSYATSDMDTMPWHNIHLGSIRINGARMIVTDTRGLTAQRLAFYSSPASSFEGIRLADFTCPDMRVVMCNRSGTVALANIPVRCIPGHRWAVTGVIVHDSTNVQAFVETGGGTAYNVSKDNRIRFAVDHSVSSLGSDPWEVETGTYASVNLWRQFRVNKSGTLSYVNTDDLPLGIVPQITAADIGGGNKVLKIYDAIAVFMDGVMSGIQTTLGGIAGLFGAREIRFHPFSGDEGSAGVIDYGQLDSTALAIHGKGTTGSNRKIKLFDNVDVNGNVVAAGRHEAPSLRTTAVTNAALICTTAAGDIASRGPISLSTEISGILGISHGGTGSDDTAVVRSNFDVYSKGETLGKISDALVDYYTAAQVDTLLYNLSGSLTSAFTAALSGKADHGTYTDSNGDTVSI